MMGGWMNLKTRKLAEIPEELITRFNETNKTLNYKELTNKDTRRWNKTPKNLTL
jgi:acyl-CoA thioester hydrolase